MAQSGGNLERVTVWLRQDAVQPSVYSARFRIHSGCGWFKWPSASLAGIPAAVSAGTAGGLHLEDALGLVLRFKVDGRGWRDVTVLSSGVPSGVDREPGEWVEVSLSADAAADEPTDVASAPDLDNLSTESLPLQVTPLEEEEDGSDLILEPLDTLPGKPRLASRGGSALVKSLVTRIRQQETEIAALKRRIVELEAG